MEEPRRIDKYRIDEELAHSSICSVFRGYEESLNRPVLIKKLHPQMAREDDIRSRFEREAQVCAQVRHDNIVSIYGYFADPEKTMLVLEFIEGQSIANLIGDNNYIPWQPALVMLYFVLKGLGYAHSKSVIHRDIKPDNILVSTQGQVKISDFGLAAIEDAPKLTRQGAVVGTPAYMPPEQVTGASIDQRSDLFSLGASFYEAVTGTSPFYAENFSEIMKKVLNAHPQNPSVVIPDIPAEFDQIILRLIEKQPTKRYSTAEAAMQDIKSLANQRNITLEAETIRKYLNIPNQVTDSGVRSSSSIPIAAPLKKRYPVWTGGILGLIAIIIALLLPDSNQVLDKTVPRLTPLFKNQRGYSTNTMNKQETSPVLVPPTDSATMLKESISSNNNQPVVRKSTNNTEAIADQNLPGTLQITSKPWAVVTIDNKTFGQTPLMDAIELSPGEHQLVFANDQFPTPVQESVIIKPGKKERLDVDLWEYFAIFRIKSVKPWAEIFIDGISYGETPRSKPIILPFGKHTIELRNPDYETWRETVELNRGDPPFEVSAELVTIAQK
ncbi:protein kinase [bacterium]|nr:protein kinase [bacterium]